MKISSDFKKGSGCPHTIATVCNVVDHYINSGSTANICSIDLSKAFDKVNHHTLFIKLLNRNIPNKILTLLEKWLSNCWSYVKWNTVFSPFIKTDIGVRQGLVLSTQLFAIYLNDVANCLTIHQRHHIIVYADDVLIIAPSVTELQRM